MWVRFCYDHDTGGTNFKPGDQVEVPDEVVRRWQLIYELFYEAQIEMGDWKARSWSPETKRLPSPASVVAPFQEVG